MAQLLIDTDVLIDYLRDRGDSVAYLENLTAPLSISAITVAELYAGVRDGAERASLDQFVDSFQIVAVDEPIASRARALFEGTLVKPTERGWRMPSLLPPLKYGRPS